MGVLEFIDDVTAELPVGTGGCVVPGEGVFDGYRRPVTAQARTSTPTVIVGNVRT